MLGDGGMYCQVAHKDIPHLITSTPIHLRYRMDRHTSENHVRYFIFLLLSECHTMVRHLVLFNCNNFPSLIRSKNLSTSMLTML